VVTNLIEAAGMSEINEIKRLNYVTVHGGLTVTGTLTAAGGIAMDSGEIRFGTARDQNHTLGYKSRYGSISNLDGPVLVGFGGGGLGTPDDKLALSWKGQDVTVHGGLTVEGEAATFTKGLTVHGTLTVGGKLMARGNGRVEITQEGWQEVKYEPKWERWGNGVWFFKDSQGIVHLRGNAYTRQKGQNPIFKLQTGYLPEWEYVYSVLAGHDGSRALVHVQTNGEVEFDLTGGGHTDHRICFDGIAFRAA
jgi:hypothetical protein